MKDLRVGAAIEAARHPDLEKDAGALAGIAPIGVALAGDLRAAIACDVWVDFTFHEAVPGNLRAATEAGRAVVIGTTGLNEAETRAAKDASGRIPILSSPNMSLGVNLLFELVHRAASVLGPDYDAEIVEMHHRHKKDSPSGTALGLAEHLAAGRRADLKAVACYGRKGLVGARPRGEIGIHAVRGGDVVGDHRVFFAADGERVELAHTATSRDAFARGALRAAVWLRGRAPGLYSMRDVLGLSAPPRA
jgi:4-hydroxy-tetrahydrodipicolinate reductase